jgi:8-oxo-dGTP pyrophosphatase MutT (NUDIX family)
LRRRFWKEGPGEPFSQVAALPIRRDDIGEIEVLLITSRKTRHWIIPKGWPMRGRSDPEAAAQEALEEAGIEGQVQTEPFGKYLYSKRCPANSELCMVYLLEVTHQRETWLEKGEREVRWFSVEDAAALVEKAGLTEVIASLGARKR